MRADGKHVKNESVIVSATPYFMPHRYDAQNMVTEYVDMEPLRAYIRDKRKEGVRITYMGLVIAAYHKAYLENPKINRFVAANKKIYQRNHFCVSFVMLKKRPDGTPDEALLKVYIEPGDDILTIQRKIDGLIAENAVAEEENKVDKFAKGMFALPFLPGIVLGLARFADRLGILPRKLIDISPFHTSMFITNLASINTTHIFHHAYDFGTTSVFLCMGKPVADFVHGNYDKKILPLSGVMDERICSGVEYAQFWVCFNRYLKHPELLESGCGKTKTEEDEKETAAE